MSRRKIVTFRFGKINLLILPPLFCPSMCTVPASTYLFIQCTISFHLLSHVLTLYLGYLMLAKIRVTLKLKFTQATMLVINTKCMQ